MENKDSSSHEVSTETLQLNPKELEVVLNPSFIIEHETLENTNVIYGRLLSGKQINKAGLKNLFESLWQNKAGVKIEEYAEGIIILTSESEAIKNRILKGQPWHFAGSYLILVEADAMTQITMELFQQIPFWVQVFGIPPGHLVKPYGERLGMEIANSMGEFMEFDPNYQKSFMRFRVRLDTSKPLLRGKLLKLHMDKENIWVSFRFERLSKFCFFCGHLDHIQKDCVALVEEVENGNKPVLQYNESLKAAGLGHVISPERNLAQKSKNNHLLQIALEATRTQPKFVAPNPTAKRMRTGNTSSADGSGTTTTNKEKQKAEEGASNTIQSVPKSYSKGNKESSPLQKSAGKGT